MTTFKISMGSFLPKALSAGLVVAAIFTTPLQARESRTIDRHTEQSVGVGAFRSERNQWMAMPTGALASRPQLGRVCDVGDDPMIC